LIAAELLMEVGMNKVILMGRLTKDPELRYTNTNNTAVCSFSLAVDRRFQNREKKKQPILLTL